MKTYKLTEYWAKQELQFELAMLKAIGHNAYSMMKLDIDNFVAGDDSPWLAEIERQFAYLEAGLVPQDTALYSMPANQKYLSAVIMDRLAL